MLPFGEDVVKIMISMIVKVFLIRSWGGLCFLCVDVRTTKEVTESFSNSIYSITFDIQKRGATRTRATKRVITNIFESLQTSVAEVDLLHSYTKKSN